MKRSIKVFISIVLLPCLVPQVYGFAGSSPIEALESGVKAAYLSKMVGFIKWPENAKLENQGKPFIIGYIGDETEADELKAVYRGQTITKHSKTVNVLFITKLEEILTCNLLFISETGKIDITKVLDMIKDKPILTVSDARGMIQKGCHIRMFTRRERIRFEVNEDSLKKSMLKPSYHLLRAADKTFKQGRFRRQR